MSFASVMDTLGYVRRFAGETVLVKLGGAALQDLNIVEQLCRDLALVRSVGISVVLVHGGGPAINRELELHGLTWEFKDGQRVTTPAMMDVVEMVLCGQVNRKIVRALNASGVRAVGLSGTDARLLKCRAASRELGRVGKVESVDTSVLKTLLDTQSDTGAGLIPVIAPVGYGADGSAFNINADTAASRVTQALGIRKLIYLTDQDGIWDADKQILSEVDAGELENLIETGVVQGGMLAKVRAILDALRNGVEQVHILNGQRPHALIEELFTAGGVGTVCVARQRARTARKEARV